MRIVDEIINKYQNNNSLYIGEKVTITEHMIQTAMLAEENHSPESLICACLLHDYGHFIIEDPDHLVSKSMDGKHEDIGFNYRLPNISAAIGLGQFNQIDKIFSEKKRIYERYKKNLQNVKGINIPKIREWTTKYIMWVFNIYLDTSFFIPVISIFELCLAGMPGNRTQLSNII